MTLTPSEQEGLCPVHDELDNATQTRWLALKVFDVQNSFNPLNAELNPICYLRALLAHHFLHVSRIRVKSLTLRLLKSYIYIYDISSLRVNVADRFTYTRQNVIRKLQSAA